MEMATKLCAINDTKLFVLLSTSMGRKVVGAPELCNQFFRQQLHADGTEVYLEYDHDRNAMMEVPIRPFDRCSSVPVFPGGSFGIGGTSSSRKRTSTDGGSEERSKSPRLGDSHGDGGGSGIESQFEAWDTDDAECLVIEEKPEVAIAITSAFSTSTSSSKHSNGASYSAMWKQHQGPVVARTPTITRTITPSRHSSKGGNPDFELGDDIRSQLAEFFAENQYAHAFVDCDALNVTNRDSKEHKVLASLIMQFAKHCGPYLPDDKPNRVAFINHSFDVMWQHLPNLHSYENHVINNGHQNYSMRGYCKTRFSGRMNSINARATRR